MNWLWLLPLLGGLALAALCVHVLTRVRHVGNEVEALLAQTNAADADTNDILARMDGMRLTVEILNPLQVARANSRLAGPASGVSPGLVRRRVYEQMSSELQGQLSERGIEAQIEVLRGEA